MPKLQGRILLTAACFVLPIIVFASVWIPLIRHYYVPNTPITIEMIDVARQEPADLVLDEIRGFFQSGQYKYSEELVAQAEHILQGKVKSPHGSSTQVGLPFDANDLDKKLSDWNNWKIYFASFGIPKTLIQAYQLTGQDDFLLAAKELILSFASYERNAWLPKGFLWNEHAIAERISVMAIFWKLYRNHPDYQPETAKELFQSVARSAQFLAKPAHFKFGSNHGIMQNIALLQICLAFPTLPYTDRYKEIALARLRDQMLFYVNDEGVVLEHSAGYQLTGVNFLSMAFRYLELASESIPQEWKSKYWKAIDFYSQLRRPNGSLPLIGDTNPWPDASGPLVANFDVTGKIQPLHLQPINYWTPKKSNSLYPVAGYSIWWEGLDKWPNQEKLSQTVVTWSHFQGHAHKHADEMSVLLWAGGESWWTNTGYWPYGTKGRREAVSWAGSNAPHLVDEPTNSLRTTNLVSYGFSDRLAVIDLERRGPKKYVARRQCVHFRPDLWIVIDHTTGLENSRTTTIWTTSSVVTMSEGKIPGSYILKPPKSDKNLVKNILASAGTDIRLFRGSLLPFAGWVQTKPSSSIVVEQPANASWAAAIWSLEKNSSHSLLPADQPVMQEWQGPDNWKLAVPIESSIISISRRGNRIFLNKDTDDKFSSEFPLIKPLMNRQNFIDIRSAYAAAAAKYPKTNYYLPQRLKVTYFIIAIFSLQEIFFLIYRKSSRRYYTRLRVLNVFGWAGGLILLHATYL